MSSDILYPLPRGRRGWTNLRDLAKKVGATELRMTRTSRLILAHQLAPELGALRVVVDPTIPERWVYLTPAPATQEPR